MFAPPYSCGTLFVSSSFRPQHSSSLVASVRQMPGGKVVTSFPMRIQRLPATLDPSSLNPASLRCTLRYGHHFLTLFSLLARFTFKVCNSYLPIFSSTSFGLVLEATRPEVFSLWTPRHSGPLQPGYKLSTRACETDRGIGHLRVPALRRREVGAPAASDGQALTLSVGRTNDCPSVSEQ